MTEELRTRPEDQPLPQPGRGPLSHDTVISQLRWRYPTAAVLESLCADVKARQELGISRYGRPLQAHNGRDVLLDLYEELLDGLAYCATAMEEFGTGDRHLAAQLVMVFDDLMSAAKLIRELRSERGG